MTTDLTPLPLVACLALSTASLSATMSHIRIWRHCIVLIWLMTTINSIAQMTKGLESIVNAGNSLGKGLKNKAVIAGMAAALPFMVANYARASEGVINIDYYVSGVGGSSFRLVHLAGSLEGKDNNDFGFTPMFCPDCEFTAKAVSSIEGEEYIADCRPIDSTSSGTVSCSMISKSGEPIVVENARAYLIIETISGFEGYNVFVNGENARETSSIDFGTLTGSYGSGETIRTVETSFQEVQQQAHAPDVETLYLPSGNIHDTSATLEGRVIDDGFENCEWQFSYWPISNPGNITSTSLECCKNSGETFSKTVYGLSSGSAYSFVAKAKNSKGTDEGGAISFTTLNGTEPNEPNEPVLPPNTHENPIAGTWGTNTLFIVNKVGGYYDQADGAFALALADGAVQGLDAKDVTYKRPLVWSNNTKIISLLVGPGRFDRYELTVDARPKPTTGSKAVDLRLSVESASGGPVNFSYPVENKLVFSFPKGTVDNFSGMPLTIWRYDLLHADVEYPVISIRDLISVRKGEMRLDDLGGSYESGVTYSYWKLSATRKPGDVVPEGGDAVVDLDDYLFVEALQGFRGTTVADVGGRSGAIPDGRVDGWDLKLIYERLSGADKAKVPPPEIPDLVEGFESGRLEAGWSSSQWLAWQVSSGNACFGAYCAKSAAIDDEGSTSLTYRVEGCEAGEVSFYRRVSSEKGCDRLGFSIDGKLQGQWSGELPWERVSFPIEAGNHTFRWEYTKDGSTAIGEDAAWIDEVIVLAAPGQ